MRSLLTCTASVAAHIDRPVAASGALYQPRCCPADMQICTDRDGQRGPHRRPGAGRADTAPADLARAAKTRCSSRSSRRRPCWRFTTSPPVPPNSTLVIRTSASSRWTRSCLAAPPDPYAANFLPVLPAVGVPTPTGLRLQQTGSDRTGSSSKADPNRVAPWAWPVACHRRVERGRRHPGAYSDSFGDRQAEACGVEQLAGTPPPAVEAQRAEMQRVFNHAVGGPGPEYFLLDGSGNSRPTSGGRHRRHAGHGGRPVRARPVDYGP